MCGRLVLTMLDLCCFTRVKATSHSRGRRRRWWVKPGRACCSTISTMQRMMPTQTMTCLSRCSPEGSRSGREPLPQRGRASTGLSTALIARCVVLVRTVVGALSARSAVGHKYASTVVSAMDARNAVGLLSASTVVDALYAKSVVGQEYASTVVGAIGARSAAGKTKTNNA